MKTVAPEQIRAVLTHDLVLSATRRALIAAATGAVDAPPPMHLAFPADDGDCHVKAGWVHGDPLFTVKIATGFYGNAAAGLPAGDGLMVVVSATTGLVQAVLVDEGAITAARTAAGGALAAHLLTRPDAGQLVVVGTGTQARLQALWLAGLRPLTDIALVGRDPARTDQVCRDLASAGLPAHPASADDVRSADIIITTTPATEPVLDESMTGEDVTIVAIGADMPFKQELSVGLMAKASLLVADHPEQSVTQGDLHHAVAAGALSEKDIRHLGDLLGAGAPESAWPHGIRIADLTGVGCVDAAVAASVLGALSTG